jgi:hypothetical protein
MADSSTEAMPSTTVPSLGIISPASTTTTSPRRSSDARRWPPSSIRAMVSVRIARRAAAWALPRPSASASAKLANTTVSHSQTLTVKVNHQGSLPPPNGPPPNAWISQATVVMAAPISTTNITGLRAMARGCSLRGTGQDGGTQDRQVEGSTGAPAPQPSAPGRVGWSWSSQRELLVRSARFSSARSRPARRAPQRTPVGLLADQRQHPVSGAAHRGDAVGLDAGVRGRDVRVDPEAESVIASTGTPAAVSPDCRAPPAPGRPQVRLDLVGVSFWLGPRLEKSVTLAE